MNSYRPLSLPAEEVESLRGSFLREKRVVTYAEDPKRCAQLSALGLHREVGTVNDQLVDFIFDPLTERRIARSSIRSEMVEYRGFVGVRIWSEGVDRLELRLKGGRELLHPTFSFRTDGELRQLVIFPESVAKIARLRGAELAVVPEWSENTIFGGFDPSRRFYETNAWELVHNDTLRYATLLEAGYVAFLGTHDLVAHIAGLETGAIDELRRRGESTRRRLLAYFSGVKTPSIYSLVLPYAAGVLLDDLAQSGNYGAPGRRAVFEEVMRAIDRRATGSGDARILLKFPASYEKLIEIARDPDGGKVTRECKSIVRELIRDLRRNSVRFVREAGSSRSVGRA